MKKDVCLLFLDTSSSIENIKESYKQFYNSIANDYDLIMVYKFNTTTQVIAGNPIKGIDDAYLSFYGGSYLSSAFKTALVDIISYKAVEDTKNTYDVIVVSDFENWNEDNEKAAAFIKEVSSKLSRRDSIRLIKLPYGKDSLGFINNICNEKYELDILKYVEEFNLDIKSTRLIYEIAHKLDYTKTYQFRGPKDIIFTLNEMVVCDTSKGKTFGKIVKLKHVDMYDNEYEQLKCISKLE